MLHRLCQEELDLLRKMSYQVDFRKSQVEMKYSASFLKKSETILMNF